MAQAVVNWYIFATTYYGRTLDCNGLQFMLFAESRDQASITLTSRIPMHHLFKLGKCCQLFDFAAGLSVCWLGRRDCVGCYKPLLEASCTTQVANAPAV